MNKLVYLLAFAALTSACSNTGGKPEDSLVMDFQGRSIDIAPFYKDFPYSIFSVSKDGGKLLFFKTDDKQVLQQIDITDGADLRNATNVSDTDFSVRNCWNAKFNKADGYVYWIGDEKNDEIVNVYRTLPGSGKIEKLTDVPYIYAWNFNHDGTKLAYVARMGQNENRLDELHIIDLKSLDDTLICEDKADFRYTWGSISWKPDEKGVVLLGLKDMDRTYTNVLYIDLQTKKTTVLTDPAKEGSLSGTMVVSDWLSDDEGIYISDQDGYNNLYSFKVSTGKSKQITSYDMNIDDAALVDINNKKLIFAVRSNPIGSSLLLIDPASSDIVAQKDSELALSLGGVKDNCVTLLAGGTVKLFQVVRATVSEDSISLKTVMDTPADIENKMVYSSVKRLEIPTFDTDEKTGETRKLHAYLYTPKNPLPADKSILLVESFYGGDNRYSSDYQIYTQAGMYVLSASPRGSAGFGRDFAAMNDGDLGGNETIDMIYATKYVSDMLGIPAERVGAFGMSHGGYETMRLLTFPGEVNGTKASFPFGFGMETAGFCDIIWQHNHSNIPDWTSLEAGDPKKDSLKLMDRSPITHADKITGPLLLLHGDHDNRVHIGGSEMMANKLKELGKPYEYVIFPGLGHGIKGTENNKKFFESCFDFIEEYVLEK